MYLFSPGNWLACIVKACAWLHVHCAQEHLINKNWSSSIFEDELSECVISARATRMRKSIFMSKCMFLDDLTAILRIKFFLCVFAYLQSNVVKIKTASNHYYIQKLMISKITKFQANEKICFLSCNSDQVIKHTRRLKCYINIRIFYAKLLNIRSYKREFDRLEKTR